MTGQRSNQLSYNSKPGNAKLKPITPGFNQIFADVQGRQAEAKNMRDASWDERCPARTEPRPTARGTRNRGRLYRASTKFSRTSRGVKPKGKIGEMPAGTSAAWLGRSLALPLEEPETGADCIGTSTKFSRTSRGVEPKRKIGEMPGSGSRHSSAEAELWPPCSPDIASGEQGRSPAGPT